MRGWSLVTTACFGATANSCAAGCTSLLVHSLWVRTVHRDFVLPDLAAIVEKILRLKSSGRVMAA